MGTPGTARRADQTCAAAGVLTAITGLLLSTTLAVVPATTVHADLVCTSTWDGGAGTTEWADAANWTPDGVPGVADTACIPAGNLVVLQATPAHVAALSVDGFLIVHNTLEIDGPSTAMGLVVQRTPVGHIGDLTGSGDLTIPVGGALTSDSGRVTGTGILHIDAGATATVTGVGLELSRSIVNEGTLDWISGTISVTTDAASANPIIDNRGSVDVDLTAGSTNVQWTAGPLRPLLRSTADGATFTVRNHSAVSNFMQFTGIDAELRDATITADAGDASTLRAVSGGTLTLSGTTTVDARSLLNAGNQAQLVGDLTGAGSLAVSGTMEMLPGATSTISTIAVNGTLDTSIDLTASSIHLFNNASVLGTITGTGDVTVAAGGNLTSDNGRLTGSGTLHIEAGADLLSNIGTTITRPLDNRGELHSVTGTLAATGTITQLTEGGTVLDGGRWTVDNGAFLVLAGAHIVTNNATIVRGGATYAEIRDELGRNALRDLTQNSGTIELNNGAGLAVSAGLTNGGVLALSSATALNVSGSFAQGAAGRLDIDLAGTDPATTHSLVTASAVDLDGTLRLFTFPTFSPTTAHLRIVDGTSLTGQFATVEDVAIGNGNQWTVQYDGAAGDVYLDVGGPTAGCDVVWDGGGGDGLWATPTNWGADLAPTATDVACIPTGAGTVTVDRDGLAAGGLRVDGGALPAELRVIGGTLTVSGITDVAGSINMDAVDHLVGAHLVLDGDARITTLSIENFSTIGGTGSVTIPSGGTFNWAGGSLAGPGQFVIENGANAVATPGLGWTDRTIVNRGDMTLSTAQLVISAPGVLRNDPLGTILLAPSSGAVGDSAMQIIGDGSIENQPGAMMGAVGPGNTILQLGGFVADGTFAVDAGRVTFDLPGISVDAQGPIAIAAGATLELRAGSLHLGQSSVGPGTLELAGDLGAAATLVLDADVSVSSLRTGVYSTIDGPGTLTIDGRYVWDGGALVGTGGVEVGAAAVVDITHYGHLERVLHNRGTIGWYGYLLEVVGDGALDNSGVLVLAPPSGGEGLIVGSVTNEAAGTVRVASGSVTIEQDLDNSGRFELGASAVVHVGRNLTMSGTSQVSVGVAGNDAAGNHATVVAGTVALAGRLDVVTNYAPAGGDVVTLVTATTRTGTFSAVTGRAIGPDLEWSVGLTPTDVRLEAVPVGGSDVGVELADAANSALGSIAAWAPRLDLTGVSLPVVSNQLNSAFGVQGALAALSNPLAGLSGDLPSILGGVEAAGCSIDFVEGGAGGRPVAGPGDVIQVRCPLGLGVLDQDPAFGADPFGDGTPDVLAGLATAVGLDANYELVGAGLGEIVFGIDGLGPYVDGVTSVGVGVALPAAAALTGSATIGGIDVTVDGQAAADLTVSVGPRNTARIRIPDLPAVVGDLAVTAGGTAALNLHSAVGGVDARWHAAYSVSTAIGGAVTVGVIPSLVADLTLPGLTIGGDTASLAMVASLTAGEWHLDAQGAPGSSYALGGFGVDSLSFGVDLGPGTLAGSGSAVLAAPVPGGIHDVALSFAFDAAQLTTQGSATFPSLVLENPSLLELSDASIDVGFTAAMPVGPLVGGVDVSASSAIVLPADPVGAATGLHGALSATGDVMLDAATAHLVIAGGAIEVDLADVRFDVGAGTGANLLTVATATGSFPALGDLAVTFTGLYLTKLGTFGATSVDVASQGFAQSIGLGGVLPFDVLEVTVVFPEPATDLGRFDVGVVGRFDFSAFPDIAGFTPRISLGGPIVTPATPDAENRFTFSVAVDDLANGVVSPLDVGPLTLGFDGLPAGDYTLGGDVTLGGFAGGIFVPALGGAVTVAGPADSILTGARVDLAGTLTNGDPTVVDVEGTVTISGSLPAGVIVEDLDLTAGVRLSFGASGLLIEPRLVGVRVGAITFPFGEFLTLRAADVKLDFDPAANEPFLTVGPGGVSVQFGDAFPGLAGWGGTARNVTLGSDLVPRVLPEFGFDLAPPAGEQLGLPAFIPLRLDSVGITFPDIVTDPPPEGIALTPAVLAGLRIRVSGGLAAGPEWPIGATVDGLEVDVGKLARGEFPITNLDGISFGVEPFELPGGVVIGGGLKLGTIDVDGTTVFYGRIFGDFAVADIGGGADLVVTQFGPVLLKVHAPLGIPLGPSGVILAGVEGAAQFGTVGVPVPPVGDPVALLNSFTLPTDLTITEDVIRDAVRPAVNAHEFTWDQGFALSLAGDLIVAAAPGILSGRVTIGMNLGLPEGPNDPPGLQLVGKGEVTAYGIPLGEVGLLIDFADPIEPSFDLAFASPVPGSPLALVFPARATFGVQLRTDGVVLGTIEGLRVFLEEVLAGSLGTGQALFTTVTDDVAAQLDHSRTRPLAQLLLDVDGDGTVSASEDSVTITSQFMFDRLLGHGSTALLPTVVSTASFENAARAATALLDELLLGGGRVLADPTTFGTFVLDSSAGGVGFENLSGQAGDALATLAGVVRDATADALVAFGDRFNPSFTIEGELQPTFLGLAVGSPVIGGTLFVDRSGLFFEMEGSITEIAKLTMEQTFPPLAPAIGAALTASTLGISDQIHVGARLPFGGVTDALLGGGQLPTFQPLDPNWAVTFGGSLSVFGFEGASLSGIAFLPGQQTFLDTQIQKLFEQPVGTPIDPDRIPITTQEHYDALVEYGGMLVTASLLVPRLITDPAAQLASFPPPPDDPLQYLAWLDDVAAGVTQTDTPARVQFFVPGISTVLDDQAAIDWASNVYLEGVWDGDVLGLDLGRGILSLTPAGLALTGELPIAGLTGTVTLNTALLDSGKSLPSAGLDVALDTASIGPTLAAVGVPSVFVPPVGATGRLRAFTPGFDPTSIDRVRRNGGIEVSARLGVPGLIGSTNFSFALSPRAGGFDVVGTATAHRIGPIAGVTITDALITVEVIDGVAGVRVHGTADVLGGTATVDGVLDGDLTGALTITLDSGTMSLGGLQVSGTAVLTLARVRGQLTGSLGVLGTATLPPWLATAAGSATASVGGCIDTAGNVEARIALPAMRVGPGGLVQIGRNSAQTALPAGPATCTVPAGAPSQPAAGPLVAWRVTGGVASLLLDGNLTFLAANAAITGLTVRGSLNGSAGTGSLAVAFSGGTMNLGGFGVAGAANLTLGAGPTVSLTVTGSLTVPGLITNATVSGSGDQNGITSLSIGAVGFTLPVVNVDSATLSLARVAGTSTYIVSAGLQIDVPGVGNNLAVNGSFASNGDGLLSMTATSLSIRTASITNGSFSLIKLGSTMTLRASGRFSLFGSQLEVVQADLSLTTTAINGSLVIRPVGGGTLTLGGWTIGGTLRLSFNGSSVTIEIDNGTVGIPGWGSVNMDGSLSVPPVNGAAFTLSLPSGGLRLGGSASPFFATGTFKLSYTNNIGTLSVTNAGLQWKDGANVLASAAIASMSVGTNGAVNASVSGFTATAGGFSLTVPSLSVIVDPNGLDARLSLESGTVVVPGLPTLATPPFTIRTTDFEVTLASSNLDLGLVRLVGSVVLRRSGGLFTLSVEGVRNASGLITAPAVFRFEPQLDIAIDDLTIASNGAFSIDVVAPRLGGDIGIVNARLQVTRTGGANGTFSGSLVGGQLLVGTADPIALPALTFDTATRFDKTFSTGAHALGPFFRMSAASLRVRYLPNGRIRVGLVNPVTVGVFDGSGTLTLNDLTIETDGTFVGSVTGRLALFGHQISTATFDVRRQDGVIELRLPSSAGETLDFGFASMNAMSISGEARSDGTFSFTGSASASAGVPGFNLSGSVAVTISDSGISGSFSGQVCVGKCLTTSASMRNDGRLSGVLRIDLNGDGDYSDPFEVDASWKVYLATGAIRVDINRDGDYNDFGDVYIGTATNDDSTPPSMTQPPNLTINANIGSTGHVNVYYTVPTAVDGNVGLPVNCTPPPGSAFAVGVTTVTCTATDSSGNVRQRSFTVTVIANAATSVPSASNGTTVLVEAGGFAPFTLVSATFHSDPEFVGVFQTDANGLLSVTLTVPAGLPPGTHDVVFEGFGPTGAVAQYVQPLVVTAAPPPRNPCPGHGGSDGQTGSGRDERGRRSPPAKRCRPRSTGGSSGREQGHR